MVIVGFSRSISFWEEFSAVVYYFVAVFYS
jgi:hypothetical protein